jgi:hypothetical protein
VVQHNGSGCGVGWKHWQVMRWEEHRPWCAPCASLSGEKERRGEKARSTRRRSSNGAQKERRKRGVRYGDEGENREPTRMLGKEGHIAQEDEASAAQCRSLTRAGRKWALAQMAFVGHIEIVI